MLRFPAIFHHVGIHMHIHPIGFYQVFLLRDVFYVGNAENTAGIFGEIFDMGPTAWLHVGQSHLQVKSIQLDVVYTE